MTHTARSVARREQHHAWSVPEGGVVGVADGRTRKVGKDGPRHEPGRRDYSPFMDMLMGEQIARARLTDWRKLAQGLHARYLVDGFAAGARFIAAVAEAGDEVGHHPRARIGDT